MSDPDPYADDPYDRLGIDPDASKTKVKIAAAKAKNRYNPDSVPEERKADVREKLYRIREAEKAILSDETMEYGSRDMTPVVLNADLTTICTGEKVTFTVTDDDGESIEGAIVCVGDWSDRTGESGEVVYTPKTTGTLNAVVEDVEGDTPHGRDRIAIEVIEDGSLDITPDMTEVIPGETVWFEITDADGDLVEDVVNVSVGGRKKETTDGTVSFAFEDRGTYEVVADRHLDSGKCITDTTEITVSDRDVPLEVEFSPTNPTVRTSIEFKITADGSPIKSSVECNGTTRTTGGEGTVELPGDIFKKPDEYEILVTADGPRGIEHPPARKSIEITAETVPAEIKPPRDVVPTGKPIEFRVRRTDTYEPIDGVGLQTSTGQEAVVRSGDASLSFESPASDRVRVTLVSDDPTVEYDVDPAFINVVPKEVSLELELSKRSIDPGGSVDIIVGSERDKRVEDIIIEADGKTYCTDEEDRIPIEFDESGKYTITANKDDPVTTYVQAKEVVFVGESALSIEFEKERPQCGDPVTVTVVNSRTGDPLRGAKVEAEHDSTNDTITKTTGRDGECQISFETSGTTHLTAEGSIDGSHESSERVEINPCATTREDTPDPDPGPNQEDLINIINNTTVSRIFALIIVFSLTGSVGTTLILGSSYMWTVGVSLLFAVLGVIGFAQSAS